MEGISVTGEVGGAGGAYSYNALKKLDQIWSRICSDDRESENFFYLVFLHALLSCWGGKASPVPIDFLQYLKLLKKSFVVYLVHLAVLIWKRRPLTHLMCWCVEVLWVSS